MKKRWICLLLALLMVAPCIAVADEVVITDPVDAMVADMGEVSLDLPEYESDVPFGGEEDIDAEAAFAEAAEVAEGAAVAPNAVAIDLSQGNGFIVGIPAQLNVVLDPVDAQTTLTWKSSKKKVARVDAAGVLTPLKAGTTRITVTTANKKKASAKVRVYKNKTGVLIARPSRSSIKSLGKGWLLIGPRAVERKANGSYVIWLYVLNNIGRSTRINNLGLQLYIGGEKVAQRTWSRVKFSSKKCSAKILKLTFKPANLVNADPKLLTQLSLNDIAIFRTTSPTLTCIR